jgi:16S rRNA pseudouridine516 synthase
MFNKPRNCVTARTDKDHKTVMDYFPSEIKETCHPIGRLDKDTVGLLIITDNGKLTHFLAEPVNHVSKRYFFYVIGNIDDEKKNQLENGIFLKGKNIITKPAKVEITGKAKVSDIADLLAEDKKEGYLKNPNGDVTCGFIEITEGKRHQVKRMMQGVHCHIVYLKRVSMGKLELDKSLEEGHYRPLSDDEIDILTKRV